jgi:hypothetical protein
VEGIKKIKEEKNRAEGNRAHPFYLMAEVVSKAFAFPAGGWRAASGNGQRSSRIRENSVVLPFAVSGLQLCQKDLTRNGWKGTLLRPLPDPLLASAPLPRSRSPVIRAHGLIAVRLGPG